MVSKKLKDHLIVLALTIITFSSGVGAGFVINRQNTQQIESSINDFKDNINSLEVGFLLNSIGNKTLSCNFLEAKIKEIRLELNDLGEQVLDLESSTRIRDEAYFSLKKEYTSVRAEYWLMLTKLKGECDANYTIMLYFYSTSIECPECIDQGVVLSHLSSLNDDLYVVPVDADEEILIIETIKSIFNISITPSIVINSDTKITGLINEADLELMLNQSRGY